MKQWAIVGLIMVAIVIPAGAADLSGATRGPATAGSFKDDPPYAHPFSWTGGYAGLQLGYGWADTDARSGPLAGINQSYDYGTDGFLGGGHIGFNLQSGGVVYGIEADVDLTDISGTSTGSLGDTHTTSIDWMGTVRARFGFTAGRSLIYVTGGWAFGDIDVKSETGLVSYAETRHGWTVGAGIERAFARNMTARLEYRYTDFGGASGNGAGLQDDSDVTLHAVRVGVSIKF